MKKIILLGDLIDKGPASKEVVVFVLKNIEHFIVIKGNHENFVIKFLKGQIKQDKNNESLVETYFNSIKVFQEDEEARRMLFELEKHMVPFVNHPHFSVTHAPCAEKYIGKLIPSALKKQQTIMYSKLKDFWFKRNHVKSLEKDFVFLKKQSRKNNKLHVFGHVSFKDVFLLKNTSGIDTGCVTGNKLTSATYNKEQNSFVYRTVKSLQPVTKEDYPEIFKEKTSFIKNIQQFFTNLVKNKKQ